MKESTQSKIALADVEEESFLELMCYLYTKKLILEPLEPQVIVDLMCLADRFLMRDVEARCEEFLINYLAIDTCVPLLVITADKESLLRCVIIIAFAMCVSHVFVMFLFFKFLRLHWHTLEYVAAHYRTLQAERPEDLTTALECSEPLASMIQREEELLEEGRLQQENEIWQQIVEFEKQEQLKLQHEQQKLDEEMLQHLTDTAAPEPKEQPF